MSRRVDFGYRRPDSWAAFGVQAFLDAAAVGMSQRRRCVRGGKTPGNKKSRTRRLLRGVRQVEWRSEKSELLDHRAVRGFLAPGNLNLWLGQDRAVVAGELLEPLHNVRLF